MSSILEEPIAESNMVRLSGHESKTSSVWYSQMYNYLFIMCPIVQRKCHFYDTLFLIFLSC